MAKQFMKVRSGITLLPQGTTPSAPENGDIWYDSVTNKFKKRENGATSDLAGAASGPTIFGSRGTPRSIVAATGIVSSASHISTTAVDQVVFISGSGGAVTITASPAIEGHTVIGSRLRLIGRDDANTVTINTQANLVELNGSWTASANKQIEFTWDGTAWIESGRN